MMHQLTGKGKFYLYLFLLIILLSIHNINLRDSIDKFFKVKNINLDTNINEKFTQDILNSLIEFYNIDIFSISLNDLENKLNNFNIIEQHKIKKIYPSTINIKIKKTDIQAYFFENNKKIYLGKNGKKISENIDEKKNLPLIVGQIDAKNFLSLNKKLINYGFNLDDFSTFYFFKSNRWDLLYKDKFTIKLPKEGLDSSLILLKEIIENIDINNVKVIDLRIEKTIILS